MKKTLSIIIALCCCTIVMAQSSYRALVEEFQLLQNTVNAKKMTVDSYCNLAIQKGLSEDVAKAKAESFYDNTVWPKTIDMTTEGFEGTVTEADLKQLIKAYSTTEGKTAMAHSLKCASPENQQKLQTVMMSGLQPILMGGSKAGIKAPACSDAYKKKFSKYYQLAGMSSTIDAIFENLKTVLKAQMPNEAADEMISKLFNFFSENSENIMLHTCVDAITEADLDFFNKALDTEAGHHVSAANKALSPQLAAYGVQSVTDFVNSLEQ